MYYYIIKFIIMNKVENFKEEKHEISKSQVAPIDII